MTFSVVIQKEGIDAQTLFNLSRIWLARTFVDSEVITGDDNSIKELAGHGKITFSTNLSYCSIKGVINYMVAIQVKDGRLRVEMSNFTHDPIIKTAMFKNHMGILVDPLPKNLSEIGMVSESSKACYKYYYKKGKPLCEQEFNKLTTDLRNYIEQRKEAKDDW